MVSFLMQMCHQKYPEPRAVVVLGLTDLPLDPSFRIAFTGYVTLDKAVSPLRASVCKICHLVSSSEAQPEGCMKQESPRWV